MSNDSQKKWKEYGLKGIKEKRLISIHEMIIQRGDEKKGVGIRTSFKNCLEGRKSKTKGPIQVTWIMEENKFLLTDGYHRITEGLLKGETKFLAEVDWKGYSTEWKIPHKKDRFYLKNE
jgi:hypothetical protein